MRRTISAPEPNAAPPIDWDIYEAFARDSLFAVCEGDHPDAVLLRQQLRDVEFAELDYTGAGFFLTLRLASDGPTLSGSGVVGDVHVNVPGCEGPLGLLLFVKGGRAEMLEAFAYADWPDDLRGYYFHTFVGSSWRMEGAHAQQTLIGETLIRCGRPSRLDETQGRPAQCGDRFTPIPLTLRGGGRGRGEPPSNESVRKSLAAQRKITTRVASPHPSIPSPRGEGKKNLSDRIDARIH